jgi:hypothetical protein
MNGSVIAPILVSLPPKKHEIDFGDFLIRKITKEEKGRFINSSFTEGLGNTWHMAEINSCDFCIAYPISGDSDWENINNAQTAINNFRNALRINDCKINLSIYSVGSKGMISNNIHTQAERVNSPYFISNNTFIDLKKIYEAIKSLGGDEKLEVMLQRYESALSANQFPANKFVDAVTVLESLVLPNGDNGELKIRFAILISKLLYKNFGIDKKYTFIKIKDSYDIRSNFVHNGQSKKYTKEKMEYILEVTRKFLFLYVTDKNQFEKKYLEDALVE